MEPLVFKGLTTSKDVVGREIKAYELGERCLQTGSLKGVDREFEGTKVIFSGRRKIFWRPLKNNAASGKKYFGDR